MTTHTSIRVAPAHTLEWMRWLSLVCLAACSFRVSPAEVVTGDAAADTAGSDAGAGVDAAPVDVAPPDAPMIDATPVPVNLIADSNGGVIVSFTSQFCPGGAGCQSGYWTASNINDGDYALTGDFGSADDPDADRAAWSSAQRSGSDPTPEAFAFAFAGSATAVIEYVVVQNWGGGGTDDYHSTHFELYGSAGSGWTHLLGSDLTTDDAPQTFTLAAPTKVDELEFAITSSVNPKYFELGELEAWGYVP